MLDIRNLTVSAGPLTIVDDVTMSVGAGQMLGLVGESGSGKSVSALSVPGLLPSSLSVTAGEILLQGKNLLGLPESALQSVRGAEIGMIFQEPMTSLNPVFSVGDQLTEVLYLHKRVDAASRRKKGGMLAAALLERVGFASPEQAIHRYPHQLSGGQRQRVMIAMALACDPAVLIADEPTSALDVTVQAQILELLDDLRRERGLAVLLITHDLGVVNLYCNRVAVMYCGQIVEQGDCQEVFRHPRHRYTAALLHTIPAANPRGTRLPAIPGSVPAVHERPAGCRFASRCGATVSRCTTDMPALDSHSHPVRCWNPVL